MAVQSLPWEHATLSSSPKSGCGPSRVEYAEGQPVGPYVLMSLIGRGGMGEVWSAASTHSVERVAIKLPRGDSLKDTRLLERFLREATLSHEVRHDNLLGAFAMGAYEGIPYFVMPEVDGPSLSKLLARAKARRRAMPREAVLHIGLSLLDALSALHSASEGGAGTVHCDVSAGNVILSKTGGVYLADLGIAQPVGDRASGCGKRGSMSPEQIAGTEVTPRSDIFAVGVLLAQLLTDRPVYDGTSEVEVLARNYAGGLPVSALAATQPLGAVLVRALSHAAEGRYKSALAMASDLRAKSAHHGLEPSRLSLARFVARCDSPELPNKQGGQATPSTHPIRRPATLGPLGRPGTGIRSTLAPHIADAAQRMVMGQVVPVDTAVTPLVASLAQRAEYTPLPKGPCWTPFRPEVLVRCLVDIASERRTGILEVTSPQHWRRVCFVHGVITLVASSDPDELIGARLVDAGLVAEEDVQRAVEHSLRTGSQVGEALAALSGLPPLVVVRALITQTTDRFLALADTHEGELTFVKGRHSVVVAPRPVETTEVLVQRLANRLHAQTRRLSRRRHPRRFGEAG